MRVHVVGTDIIERKLVKDSIISTKDTKRFGTTARPVERSSVGSPWEMGVT